MIFGLSRKSCEKPLFQAKRAVFQPLGLYNTPYTPNFVANFQQNAEKRALSRRKSALGRQLVDIQDMENPGRPENSDFPGRFGRHLVDFLSENENDPRIFAPSLAAGRGIW